jgi:signal peptidase I
MISNHEQKKDKSESWNKNQKKIEKSASVGKATTKFLQRILLKSFDIVGLLLVFLGFGFWWVVVSMHFFSFPVSGKLVVVRSGSMEPAVSLGSIVWVVKSKTYQVGEVIAYHHPDSNNRQTAVLHRIDSILSTSPATYQTKGDANDSPDALFLEESKIIGKMVFQLKLLGYTISWMQSQVGVLSTVILPVLILITHLIRSAFSQL